jgi:uncharacterized membrane protein
MKTNIERFVNFSDAIMAIAVTLMILPLADKAVDATIPTFGSFVDQFAGSLIIFAVSFWVVCRYWLVHHNALLKVKTFDSNLFWINVAWLFAIVLVPFTSAFLGGEGYADSFRVSIYIGSLVLISYVSVALDWSTKRNAVTLEPGVKARPSRGSIANAVGFTAALGIELLVPTVGLWAILALVPINVASTAFAKYRDSRAK